MNTRDCEDFDSVRKAEWLEILERRKFFPPKSTAQETATTSGSEQKPDSSPESDEKLVGLALSGGGLRSGSVSVGFLQGLYDQGLLRCFDYLSTVSGGGYAGALLTSSIEATPKVDWNPKKHDPKSMEKVLPFSKYSAPLSTSQINDPGTPLPQPPLIQRLANSAGSLFSPISFFSRHFFGLIATNIFAIASVGTVVTLLAWLFRTVDYEPYSIRLNSWGFDSDTSRAFFPAWIFLILWIGATLCSRFWRSRGLRFPPFSAWLFGAMLISAIMSMIVITTNGNNDFSTFILGGASQSSMDPFRKGLSWLGVALLGTATAGALPLIAFKHIIRSGASPRNTLERRFFNAVSWCFLLLIPLLLFYVTARENVSGYNETRDLPYALSRGHIKDWDSFCVKVQLDGSVGYDKNPGKEIYDRVKEISIPDNPSTSMDDHNINNALTKCRQYHQSVAYSSTHVGFVRRQLNGIMYHLTSTGQHEQLLQEVTEYAEVRDKICDKINRSCLAHQDFFETFQDSLDSSDKEQQALVLSANALPISQLSGNHSLLIRASKEQKDLADRLRKKLDELSDSKRASLLQERDDLYAKWWLATQQDGIEVLSKRTWLTEFYDHVKNVESRFSQKEDFQDPVNQENLRLTREVRKEVGKLVSEVQKCNVALLREYFGPELLYDEKQVFSKVVFEEDQKYRLKLACWMLIVSLISGSVISLNSTSIHSYYADQLSKMWIVGRDDVGSRKTLKHLNTCHRGGPLHLVNGTLNLYGRSQCLEKDRVGRFTFSKTHCGAERTGYQLTQEYMQGGVTLADAIAISGGAVSPMSMDNILVRVLLMLANFRLGKWMHHPARPPFDVSWPSPLALLWQAIAAPAEDRKYLFISDGGHNDNTGISTLLQRKCRLIVALDASCDPKSEFECLLKLLRDAEPIHGVRIRKHVEIDESLSTDAQDKKDWLKPLRHSAESRYSLKHFMKFKVTYADGTEGVLIYVKSTLTGDEGPEIVAEAAESKEFPHESTADLFYSPARFHSYRELGVHLSKNRVFEEIRDELQSLGYNLNPNDDVEADIRDCKSPEDVIQLVSTRPFESVERIAKAMYEWSELHQFNFLTAFDDHSDPKLSHWRSALQDYVKRMKTTKGAPHKSRKSSNLEGKVES